MAPGVVETCKAIGREIVVAGHSAGGLVAGVAARDCALRDSFR